MRVTTKIATFDKVRSNLILISSPGGIDATPEDCSEFMHIFIKLVSEMPGRGIVIYDGTKTNYLDKEGRKVITGYLNANKELYLQKVIETAIITPTIISRVVMKTVILLIDTDIRLKTSPSLALALDRANNILDNDILTETHQARQY